MSPKSSIIRTLAAVFATILLLGLTPSGVTPAWADDDPEVGAPVEGPALASDKLAREHYLRGERYYAEGDYEAAIPEFQEAYDLSGRPKLLFNLANTHERLGNYEEALEVLRRYAKTVPEFEHDSVARRIRNLEKRADEKAQRVRDATPPPRPITPTSETSPTPLQTNLETTQPKPAASTPTLGWVLVGTGVALAAGGATSGVLALRARNDAEALCQQGRCPEGAQGSIDNDKLYSAVSDIGIGLGATTAIVGLILVWRHDEGGEQSPVSASVQANGINLSYSGSF